jgi:hypothetical protein
MSLMVLVVAAAGFVGFTAILFTLLHENAQI